jgi:LPXTG-motif cell wall-anchored protein
MKKIRKILALAMALAMMMGMTIIASAAESFSATILVDGITAEPQATITYAQVIKADQTTRTGWAIVPEYAEMFKDFGQDEQSRIEAYMDEENTTDAERLGLLKDVATSETTTNPIAVTAPGLYVIHVTQEGYDYNIMLAYVSYDDNGKQVTVNAKKTPKKVEKTVDEADGQVEINDEITYSIEATIPFIPVGSDKKFEITDILKGASFKLNDNKNAEITVSGETAPREVKPVVNNDSESLTIDLTDLTVGNGRANTTITLTYTVIVTGKVVENKAYHGDYEQNAIPVKSYTAKITIIKMNEANATEEDQELLDGAEFVIKNADDKFAKLDAENVLTAWVDTEDEATKLVTGDAGDGKATAYGFDSDLAYTVVETKAPTGYSLDNKPISVTTWVDDKDAGDGAKKAEVTVHDSKLQKLPYTGGSGTLMFTVFGVAMMCIAAGLGFILLKKGSSAK